MAKNVHELHGLFASLRAGWRRARRTPGNWAAGLRGDVQNEDGGTGMVQALFFAQHATFLSAGQRLGLSGATRTTCLLKGMSLAAECITAGTPTGQHHCLALGCRPTVWPHSSAPSERPLLTPLLAGRLSRTPNGWCRRHWRATLEPDRRSR